MKDAETLAQEYKAFAYSVSHDLSAPIRGMVEFSKLLGAEHGENLNEEGKLYLSLIIESGVKLQNMLAALLQFSRLNAVLKPLSKVDCHAVLKRCEVLLKDKIQRTKTRINFQPLPIISADPEQLEQLFLILLDNAITFQKAGQAPQINISAQATDEGYIFDVQDNGIGISKDFHTVIFNPFKRLHGDADYAGVGMGLALAGKILARHDGRIWINSSFGSGTSVQFLIPRREVA